MMPESFHKPVRLPSAMFDLLFDGSDPEQTVRIAHSTAEALLSRVRADPQPDVLERLIEFTAGHGIDTIASLWSQSPAGTLPGTLWRIYLLQLMVRDDPQTAALLYERGQASIGSIDPVIAGAPTPAGPEEIAALADEILRGIFSGDFGVALDRAASFSRVEAAGATELANDYDRTEEDRATAFTTRAARLSSFAADLTTAARLWRSGSLD